MYQTPLTGRGLAGENHADGVLDGTSPDKPPQVSSSSPAPLIAVLIPPLRTARYSGVYSVSFHDEIVVAGSRDPEFDACRVLVQRGVFGSLKIVDASGKHRSTIPDIEKASRLCTKEGPLRFHRYESRPEPSPTGEGGEVGQ